MSDNKHTDTMGPDVPSDVEFYITRTTKKGADGDRFRISHSSYDWLLDKLYTKDLTDEQLKDGAALLKTLLSEIVQSSPQPSDEVKAYLVSSLAAEDGKGSGDVHVGYRFGGATPVGSDTSDDKSRYSLGAQLWLQSDSSWPVSKSTYEWQRDKADGRADGNPKRPPFDPLVVTLLDDFDEMLPGMRASLRSLLLTGKCPCTYPGDKGANSECKLYDVHLSRRTAGYQGGDGGSDPIHGTRMSAWRSEREVPSSSAATEVGQMPNGEAEQTEA